MTTVKTYKVISRDLGWRFSFNAKNKKEAQNKLANWLIYHSFSANSHSIEETDCQDRLFGNSYMN